MWKKLSKSKKKLYTGILCCAILITLCVTYLTSYLPANDIARQSLHSTDTVDVLETKDTITFTPLTSIVKTALIYYPGGKIDPSSFAYAAHAIAEEGILVIIQKMPFNLAIFNSNAASSIIENHLQIEHWFLSGFSLGGTAASMFASKNQDLLDGLLLYASYTTKDYSLTDVNFPVLSINGSNDGLATTSDIIKARHYLPAATKFVQIRGANHTQMALYNNSKPQHGDGVADISDMEQQHMIIDETIQFIQTHS